MRWDWGRFYFWIKPLTICFCFFLYFMVAFLLTGEEFREIIAYVFFVGCMVMLFIEDLLEK